MQPMLKFGQNSEILFQYTSVHNELVCLCSVVAQMQSFKDTTYNGNTTQLFKITLPSLLISTPHCINSPFWFHQGCSWRTSILCIHEYKWTVYAWRRMSVTQMTTEMGVVAGQHVNWHRNRRVPHDDVIRWKHFPRYWPFVWGIHRPVTWSFDLLFVPE